MRRHNGRSNHSQTAMLGGNPIRFTYAHPSSSSGERTLDHTAGHSSIAAALRLYTLIWRILCSIFIVRQRLVMWLMTQLKSFSPGSLSGVSQAQILLLLSSCQWQWQQVSSLQQLSLSEWRWKKMRRAIWNCLILKKLVSLRCIYSLPALQEKQQALLVLLVLQTPQIATCLHSKAQLVVIRHRNLDHWERRTKHSQNSLFDTVVADVDTEQAKHPLTPHDSKNGLYSSIHSYLWVAARRSYLC